MLMFHSVSSVLPLFQIKKIRQCFAEANKYNSSLSPIENPFDCRYGDNLEDL